MTQAWNCLEVALKMPKNYFCITNLALNKTIERDFKANIYFLSHFAIGAKCCKREANYNWYIHTMMGMVMVHSVAVTTLITLAYSG